MNAAENNPRNYVKSSSSEVRSQLAQGEVVTHVIVDTLELGVTSTEQQPPVYTREEGKREGREQGVTSTEQQPPVYTREEGKREGREEEVTSTEQQPPVYTHPVVIRDAVIGELNLHNAVFEQGILFERVIFQKQLTFGEEEINGEICWRDCTITKKVSWEQTHFIQGISFTNTTFESALQLEYVRFDSSLVFTDCTFQKAISCNHCSFEDTVTLKGNALSGGLSLQSCTFAKACDFSKNQGSKINFNACEFLRYFSLVNARCQRVKAAKNHFYGYSNFKRMQISERLELVDNLFHDSANFNKCELGQSNFRLTQFEKDAQFDNVKFAGRASFNDIRVNGDVFFRESRFQAPVSFKAARFYRDAHFQFSRFCQEANFTFMEVWGRTSFCPATFESHAQFYRTFFKGPAFFLGVRFQEVSFANVTFEGQALFSHDKHTIRERRRQGKLESPLQHTSIFLGDVHFTNSLFYRKTVFENVFFRGLADFENVNFAEEINFEKAHFFKEASFWGAFCSQELNFTHAVFEDFVNFDQTNISCRLNLTNSSIFKGLSFYHAVIDVVVVEQDQIANKLIYEGKVEGAKERRNYMRVKEEYLILKESYHQRGKFDEEDWAYYQYRVYDRKSLTNKAWRSLRGQPFLTIWDDIPPEERPERENAQALEHNARLISKIEKKISYRQNKIKALQEPPPAKSEAHRIYLESPEYAEKVQAQLATLQAEIAQDEAKLKELQEKRAQLEELIALDEQRCQRIQAIREKPFTKSQAVCQLAKNGLWKIVDWGTGYGVRPFRIGFLAMAVILAFALVYMCSGVPFPHPKPPSQKPSVTVEFFNWVYFSAMAFATSSPEGDIAYNPQIKFFIMFEALIGLFLMALFVGCYTRKILR